MKPFDYFEPATMEEVLALLQQYGDQAKVLSGGTDLVVQMKAGKISPKVVIGLGRLPELNFIAVDPGIHIDIGPIPHVWIPPVWTAQGVLKL